MSDLIKKDTAYLAWIQSISKRYRQSQIKAAVRVNDEMLRFYWSLGRDMEIQKETYAWGSHFYKQLSNDLTRELPEVKSFSPRNLLYMHQFYRLFPDAQIPEKTITKQLVSQLKASSQPMGISQYDIHQFLTENYRKSLPTIEEIETELNPTLDREHES